MKLSLTIALFVLFICKGHSEECYITAEVNNFEGRFVVIEKPINGYFNNISFTSTDTIQIINNRIQITVTCKRAVFVRMLFLAFPVNLIIKPGDSIFIRLDFAKVNPKKKLPIEAHGANAKGQELYHLYNYWPAEKYETIWSILKENKEQIIPSVKREIDRQMKPFENLYKEREIDKAYYDLLTANINSLLLSEVIRKLLDLNIKNLNLPWSTRKKIAIQLFHIFSPSNSNLYYSLNSFFYAKFFLQFQRVLALNATALEPRTDTIIHLNNKAFTISGDFAHLFYEKKKPIREVLFGSQIIDYFKIGGGEEILRDEVTYFETAYPNSLYLTPIKSLQAKSIRLSAIQDLSISDSLHSDFSPIIILDSTGTIKNLFKDLSFLQNHIVYVDVWASWCTPCLHEMKYNFPVDSFLSANNIRRLYISTDGLQDTLKWKTIISRMHLGGYHIIAGEQLQRFLNEKFGVANNVMAIPVYFIINNGVIVVEDAFRPSEFDNLRTQLTTELEKK